MRTLLFPTAGDAREESPAEKTRHAEDVYGMSYLYLDILLQLKVSVATTGARYLFGRDRLFSGFNFEIETPERF